MGVGLFDMTVPLSPRRGLSASPGRPHSCLVGAVDLLPHAGSGRRHPQRRCSGAWLGRPRVTSAIRLCFARRRACRYSSSSDIAHIGSPVLGPLAVLGLRSGRSCRRGRRRLGWVLPPGLCCWSLRCLRRSAARPSDQRRCWSEVYLPTASTLGFHLEEGTTGPGGGADLASPACSAARSPPSGRASFGCLRTRAGQFVRRRHLAAVAESAVAITTNSAQPWRSGRRPPSPERGPKAAGVQGSRRTCSSAWRKGGEVILNRCPSGVGEPPAHAAERSSRGAARSCGCTSVRAVSC